MIAIQKLLNKPLCITILIVITNKFVIINNAHEKYALINIEEPLFLIQFDEGSERQDVYYQYNVNRLMFFRHKYYNISFLLRWLEIKILNWCKWKDVFLWLKRNLSVDYL